MKGPSPKRPELRQRTNKAATAALLPMEGAKRRAPPLPKDCQWGKMAVAWWKDVWASPMAGEYLEADVHGLYMLGCLIESFWQKPSTKLAGEIRQQSACYGLDPISRRRLQWTIEKAETAKRRRPAAAVPGEDPRERLRVLK